MSTSLPQSRRRLASIERLFVVTLAVFAGCVCGTPDERICRGLPDCPANDQRACYAIGGNGWYDAMTCRDAETALRCVKDCYATFSPCRFSVFPSTCSSDQACVERRGCTAASRDGG